MGIADKLKGKRVFLDSAPIIYYIENHKIYQPVLDEIFTLADAGKISFISSSLTYLEVLVVPLKDNRLDLLKEYDRIFSYADSIEVIALDNKIAKLAAEIRAKYNYKTPDSIQLATAIHSECDIFLTNDKQLKQDKIHTVILSETPDNQL